MENEYSLENPIKVSNISEEYEYIRKENCKCGGTFNSKMQSLIQSDDNRPFDLIKCECRSCGEEKEFYFDISSFFGKNL